MTVWRRAWAGLAVAFAAAGTVCADGGLVWRVERLDGSVVSENRPAERFNPASVVKVATSLWAIERLGLSHRYETRFLIRGRLDPEAGVLDGHLVVRGGGDPDFQPENAWLVAAELRRFGIRRVRGDLVVSGPFSLGWEGGVEDRRTSEEARRMEAARRLRRAWDPQRWDAAVRRVWTEFGARRPGLLSSPPEIVVTGRVRLESISGKPVVVHRSNPLGRLLKRFNVFSNNDIIRIADGLGGVESLEKFLKTVVDGGQPVELSSASGEGRNRMTAEQAVALLRRFRSKLAVSGLTPREVLPVPGCDPGPVPNMFPDLTRGDVAGSVACKTGTLSATDGGVAVLAGYVPTVEDGELVFCVAAEGAGGALTAWRRREQNWLLNLISEHGGAAEIPCPEPMLYSDTEAQLLAVAPLD